MEPEPSRLLSERDPELQSERLDACIRAVQDGDRSAFRQVVEQMLPVIRPYVVSRTLPGVDVDEIVQQTFVEAYKNLGEYRLGTSVKAWLITIARYQTMKETTRLRRQADYHSRYVPVALADQMEKQLAAESVEDERLLLLRDCLSHVKDSSRELIRLRYAEDLSMQEIGESLQRTAGAVRKELCLIRKRLHECIDDKLQLAQADQPATRGGVE